MCLFKEKINSDAKLLRHEKYKTEIKVKNKMCINLNPIQNTKHIHIDIDTPPRQSELTTDTRKKEKYYKNIHSQCANAES